MRFARPVACDEGHVLGIGLIQGGIVDDKQSLGGVDTTLNLCPQCIAVRGRRCSRRV
jgi:hypothetical protein